MSLRFKSAKNGDFLVSNKDLVMIDGAESYKQGLEHTLKTHYGEWFLLPEYGIPYLPAIIGKFVNVSYIRTLIVNSILDYPETFEIRRVELLLASNRTLEISLDVVHDTGTQLAIDSEVGV